MPKKDKRVHGNRSIAPADLKEYGPIMTERELACYMGISIEHARRHRTPKYMRDGAIWPPHHREGGQRSAVYYRRTEVRDWVMGLPPQS